VAIAFVNDGKNTATSGTSVVVTYSSTLNNTLVLTIQIRPTTTTVSTVVPSAGSNWTFVNGVNNGVACREEVWISAVNSPAITSVQVNFSAAVTSGDAIVGEYSGVQSIGINNTNTGSTTLMTVALTTQDSNNWVVAGLGENSNAVITAATGNLRDQITDANLKAQALVDNTVASAGSVTCSANLATSHTWAAVAVELRTVATGNAFEDDSFKVAVLPPIEPNISVWG
jgi:hypothetical protein